ncbi:MAG TPA: hypothetical protein VNT30_07770 [Stellaceae bacterium]|nr:hypothetical protein [Stellaceae bacterium]
MAVRFRVGAVAYAKDGRTYVVDEVDDGIVYCSSPNGAETEFAEDLLMTEAEWSARSGGRRGTLYDRLRREGAYVAPAGKLDGAAATQLLAKIDRLSPGLLDFTAFTVATRVMNASGDQDLLGELSIVKCRAVFEAASPESRANLLAGLLGTQPDVLIGAGRLGDNLMRAMIDKGLAAHADAFESFGSRPRR